MCVCVVWFVFCIFLQYFDTVGWVFWPVKTVSHITYTVLEGTLNTAQSNPIYFCQISSKLILIIFSYTVSKLVRFFWDTVYNLIVLMCGYESTHSLTAYCCECWCISASVPVSAAVAMVSGRHGQRGVIRFVATADTGCLVDGTVDGLQPGHPHAVLVHEFGDLSNECDRLCTSFTSSWNCILTCVLCSYYCWTCLFLPRDAL